MWFLFCFLNKPLHFESSNDLILKRSPMHAEIPLTFSVSDRYGKQYRRWEVWNWPSLLWWDQYSEQSIALCVNYLFKWLRKKDSICSWQIIYLLIFMKCLWKVYQTLSVNSALWYVVSLCFTQRAAIHNRTTKQY